MFDFFKLINAEKVEELESHTLYSGGKYNLYVFTDKYMWESENKYDNEVSRGELIQGDSKKYFIIDSPNEGEIEFESSNGTLVTYSNGIVNNELSDISDWLLNIARVDIEELENYYNLSNFADGSIDFGDVLDFGYWDKNGTYHIPSRRWRIDTFHNVDFVERKRLEIIDEAENWVKKNRLS